MPPRRVAALLFAGACGTGAPSAPPLDAQCASGIQPGPGWCYERVEGGTFAMGAQATDPAGRRHDPLAREDEGPVHDVTIAPFWIMPREVTWGVWESCVKAGACLAADPGPTRGMGILVDWVAGLTWSEADALCRFTGGRLPTEAEWEFVARSGDDRRFPWGDEPPCALGEPVDPFQGASGERWASLPGCTPQSKSPRENGRLPVWDLAWGHWEWTADLYRPSYAPDAPETTRRVQRGGSWAATDLVDHRASARTGAPPDARLFDVGVRCAW